MARLPVGLGFGTFTSASMMKFSSVVFFALAISVYQLEGLPDQPALTFDMLYNAGVEAYLQNRWYECLSYMQRALEDFRFYRENVIDCRMRCAMLRKTDVEVAKYANLAFYDIALRRSDCLRRCRSDRFKGRLESINRSAQEAFDDLLVYDYLQICAYQSEDYEVAAAAAYTYLVGHPDHTVMQNNVVYYQGMSTIRTNMFRNLEEKPYQALYVQGVDSYGRDDYSSTIKQMEEALNLYYLEERRCTALCEDVYDHESLPELYNAVADHWIETLRCKRKCSAKLSNINGVAVEDFLPEIYNYLQFSYFKSDDVNKAAAAAASYLLLKPGDQTMLQNLDYYKHKGLGQESAKPRQDVIDYKEVKDIEDSMLAFVDTSYKFSDADEDEAPITAASDVTAGSDVTGDTIGSQPEAAKATDPSEGDQKTVQNNAGATITLKEYGHPVSNASHYGPRDATFRQSLERYGREAGISLTAEEDALQGEHRFMVDGLLTEDQCQGLMELASAGAEIGDGYRKQAGKQSPHTNYEMFEGLTVSRAAELALKGVFPITLAELYLNASEKSRAYLEKYYNLQIPVHFHFTHLACRTALEGQGGREDLSHPVHADNCIIQGDGSCLKQTPAYVQRDFTALLYLNDDFEGGNFFFAHKNQSIQHETRPRCGRMVGFDASDYHGVRAVNRGRRCALAIWFTLDAASRETAHSEASAALRHHHAKQQKVEENSRLKRLLEDKGYQLTMTEQELNGPERFAADGLATEEQCQTLIKLTNAGAVVGDGYKQTPGRSSPFTLHEAYAGMTVARAAKLAADQEVSAEAVKLYLDMSDAVSEMVSAYFKLDQPLYYDFTHLVCRTALDVSKKDRTDLSHPIHSDNCIIRADGRCVKEAPAYVQRDYSAILYLNDDFTGGEFIFAHENMTVQSVVNPSCGLMVGFNAGIYHGVKAVLTGQRCAVALWFTLDPKYNEESHNEARNVLKKLRLQPEGPGRSVGQVSDHGGEL